MSHRIKRDVNADVQKLTKFVEDLSDETNTLFGVVSPDVVHAIDSLVYDSHAEDTEKAKFWGAALNFQAKRVALGGKKHKKV